MATIYYEFWCVIVRCYAMLGPTGLNLMLSKMVAVKFENGSIILRSFCSLTVNFLHTLTQNIPCLVYTLQHSHFHSYNSPQDSMLRKKVLIKMPIFFSHKNVSFFQEKYNFIFLICEAHEDKSPAQLHMPFSQKYLVKTKSKI